MERGYLIAALALIATFTGLSRGIQSLEHWSLVHVRHVRALAKAECHANPAARAAARLQTHIRPHYAEEAQLLAEMNMPPVDIASTVTEQAQQNVAAAHSAQAKALREAERARSEVLRMQQQLAEVPQAMRIEPLSLRFELPADVQRQIERSSAIAAKRAEREVRLQIARHQRCAEPPSPPDFQAQ